MIASILALALMGLGSSGQRSEEEVRQEIEKALSKDKIKVQVSLQGGTVTLKGEVRNVFQKNRAVEIALAQPEVKTADAEIEVAAAESDQKLGEEVVKEIRKYSRFTVFDDITAYIDEGSVALFGWVTEPYKKTEIEKRLHKVIGVQSFKNEIEVLPASLSDQRLREVLVNRLYRDSTFSDFASMPIPPIHIIVSGSRVILTGVVGNQLMKQKAESIIRGTPGVLSVESRLRIES
ncbi:MAG: BON domain-containing protein [Vicinamibacteria bacterium]